MKNLRFSMLILVFLIFMVYGVSCLDLGGNIDNYTTVSSEEDSRFSQVDKFSLWLTSKLSRTISFVLQGSYTYSLDIPYLFDVDILNLRGEFPIVQEDLSMFRYAIGRFLFSDFSTNVLYHNADGLQLAFHYPTVILTTSFGYTGLLLKPNSSIIMSKADSLNLQDEESFFSLPRLIGVIELQLPELCVGQDLFLSFLFQQDLSPAWHKENIIAEGEEELSPAKSGCFDTQYLGTGLSGRMTSSLYYDTSIYLGTGRTLSYLMDETSSTGYSYHYMPIISFLGGVGIRGYLEKFVNSILGLKFLFASGDADHNTFIEGNTEEESYAFVPISTANPALVFSPNLSNSLLIEASYSIKPIKNLQTLLKAICFLRPTTGPISESGIDPDSESLYLGTEIDGTINFRPLSDLGLDITAGVFMPNTGTDGAFLENRRELEIRGRLEVFFSF